MLTLTFQLRLSDVFAWRFPVRIVYVFSIYFMRATYPALLNLKASQEAQM
jgi:hypothetical protein